MAQHARSIGFFLGCLLLTGQAAAETVYVTDMLQLGLYPEPGDQGQPLKTLPSGTPLEVQERNRNYARVRTPAGVEGWAKAAYLVANKPARARLTELETRNRSISEKLAALRDTLAQARQRAEDLEQRAASSAILAGESRQRLEVLHRQNQHFRKALAGHRSTVALPWLFGTSGLSLALGLVGGVWLLDYRIRRRHGGYRVY